MHNGAGVAVMYTHDVSMIGNTFSENSGSASYGLLLKDEVPFEAETGMGKLAEMGVGTRPFFWPMHEQPVFRKRGLFHRETYPVSERLARRGFYVPSGLAMTNETIGNVARSIREVLATAGAHT